MDTRDTSRLSEPGGHEDFKYEERGLGPWVRRNSSLLFRLFFVLLFSLLLSIVGSNLSYNLQGAPTPLTVEQLNSGRLPAGTEPGDYVEVRGTANVGPPDARVGLEESEIAISSRYRTAYYYFRLQETGNNFLIQTTESLPQNLANPDERVWRGKLETVGTVIFYSTTQEGLERAGLPTNDNIPVINTAETPQYLRQFAISNWVIVGLWLSSVAWLIWKRNTPFL